MTQPPGVPGHMSFLIQSEARPLLYSWDALSASRKPGYQEITPARGPESSHQLGVHLHPGSLPHALGPCPPPPSSVRPLGTRDTPGFAVATSLPFPNTCSWPLRAAREGEALMVRWTEGAKASGSAPIAPLLPHVWKEPAPQPFEVDESHRLCRKHSFWRYC